MKARDVEIGGVYLAKVSGELVPVKIESACSYGGWYAQNLRTGRPIRIKSPLRLRKSLSSEEVSQFTRG